MSLLPLNGLRISEALSADITAMASERGHRTLTVLRHPGCSPADSPADPSAPTNSQNACAGVGIRPAQARSTALFSLATELPAAILARLLGIHITVAVQWQHAAPGDDWTTYAAHYSRRANTSTASREQPQTAPHLRQPRRFEYLTPPVRVRASLDRHATYILARYLASAAR